MDINQIEENQNRIEEEKLQASNIRRKRMMAAKQESDQNRFIRPKPPPSEDQPQPLQSSDPASKTSIISQAAPNLSQSIFNNQI